ncbi:MAG TPA: hypothetical protein VGA50_05855 [Kiloniellales bacterium]
MRRCSPRPSLVATIAIVLLAGSWAPAVAGHEVGFYPSYYPHEIRLETLDPARAAALLADKTLHAYIGAAPDRAEQLPGHVKWLESLGSLVVLRLNPDSPRLGSDEQRCAAARDLLAGLRDGGPDFVFHPYPVTPYHADYLHHVDRVEDAKAALETERPITTDLRVRAEGRHAEALVRAHWRLATGEWDASLEDVPVDDLIAGAGRQLNGWLGPPWFKEGWFQAYRLLAPTVTDAAAKEIADSLSLRLVQGDYLDLAERATLERRLLAALGQGCDRMVAGYTVAREYYNADDSEGIENIAYDSLTGMNTPVFIRTAKLKDYPWNGVLNLGIDEQPQAAWNPVAGFTDAPGRLIWSALGDPALLPMPYNASWVPNRVDFTLDRAEGQSGGIRVPADSVVPEAGTGLPHPLAGPAFATVKLTYTASASPFLDGTDTEIADLLYAFVLAYRWSARESSDDAAYDPSIAGAAADIRDRLVGLRTLRVDQTVNQIAPDVQIVQNKPVIEIYLRDTPGDPQQTAALAPPWSTIPWHLAVLMEEAVLRGLAAFSQEEAERRGVPWLDLVRDASLQGELRALIDEFEAAGYRPAALHDVMSEDQARARWHALRSFVEANGHLLVTNGPYQLKEWQSGPVVLAAVREATYPMGFGTFDQFVQPLHAVVREATREDGRITVRVDVEKTVKAGRSYHTESVPLNHETARGIYGALIVSRYLLIAPDGPVIRADKMDWQDDGRFVVALPQDLPPGRHTVLAAVYLDGNSLMPSTAVLRFETGQ